jgi:hypothetical protein
MIPYNMTEVRFWSLVIADVNSTAHTLLLATNSLLPYSLSAGELGERAKIEKKVARLSRLPLYGLLRGDSA